MNNEFLKMVVRMEFNLVEFNFISGIFDTCLNLNEKVEEYIEKQSGE
ncbi:hypothetical protein [Oceanobacillus saliphilus]|nr:hypothetical protein [Oceanobacillus saliphilus]